MDKDTLFGKKQIMNCRGKYIDLSDPKIMGILNITPDSFYDGGKYLTREAILSRTGKMISEGADIIDIGAYSSRPGATHISEKEEIKRLTNALEIIRKKYPEQILSVDTFRSAIARFVTEEFDVAVINDISGGTMDKKMHDTIAELNAVYIVMHMQGTPQNMQNNTGYNDLISDVMDFLGDQIGKLRQKGVNDLIIDPGFGFGKSPDQNYRILAHLNVFGMLDCPVLAGISRKSMIYRILDTTPGEALTGTIALNMLALMNGADILRVHDVKEAVQTIQLFLKVRTEGIKYIDQHK
ncbi:MAG: dihydropteroate synthase [Bacteroidales bacterium]